MPFADCFEVSRDMLTALVKRLDEPWMAKASLPSFYDLEDELGGKFGDGSPEGWDRTRLYSALRYVRLADRFDDRLFSALVQNAGAPSECNDIMDDFRDDEIGYQ